MKGFQVIILLIFISSCKTTYEGIKRIETQVEYRHNIYGEPIKRKRWKRKIEYRIYDKDEKLIEIGAYGERGGFSQLKWNPIDSTLEITSGSFRNYKKLDFIEYFKYDDKGQLVEKSFSRCRDNKIHHLVYRDKYNHRIDSMENIVYKENGEIRSSSNSKLKLPLEMDDEIYNQKLTNVGSRIVLTEKQEFIYDNKNRLVKILHKDKYDNLLGYTRYKYKRLKKRTRKRITSSHRF